MAASRYEVEVTVSSARDLKNVNWRNGDLKPYAVLWIDSGAKCSTRVDIDNGENPTWDDKLTVPLPPTSRLDDAVLYLDVVHANAADGVKPLVGSASLPLRDVLADAGIGGRASRSLRLKRPSGRPQGRAEVRVAVREPARYYDPSPAPAGYPAPYQQQQQYSRDPYAAGGAYGGGYGGGYGAAPAPYAAAPPAGYPSAYGAPQPAAAGVPYVGGGAAPPTYGAAPPTAGVSYGADAKKKNSSRMGLGGGLAVGAAAGVLGGLALAGGASYLENKFEERVAERVEDNLESSYGGGGGFDDDGDDDGY
uniref:C2 domain-containing protein n=1 Tax=Leersia perrieri TaxID=77586 RepID=A0A0D9XH34_9ORYZ